MKRLNAYWVVTLIIQLISLLFLTISSAAIADQDHDACLLRTLKQANNNDSVQLIRETCNRENIKNINLEKPHEVRGLISRRLQGETKAGRNRFSIVQHKGSYILPITNNGQINRDPYEDGDGPQDLNSLEAKFQFSLKAQVFDAILSDRGRIFVGYTNQTYWQLYNHQDSVPIREANHQPEIFLDVDLEQQFLGWHMPLVRYGFAHQSNGQINKLSRSWNRVYAQLFFEKNDWAISFQPWIRVDGDSGQEDNANITKFMGNFELGIFRRWDTATASMMVRNNLRSENRGSVELNWTKQLPFSRNLRLIVQYYNGYGESLIDYDANTNRIGVGLQLGDIL